MAGTSKASDYDPIFKDIDKLEGLYFGSTASAKRASTSKSKAQTVSVQSSLDVLLASLLDAKQQLESGNKTVADVASIVSSSIETSKTQIEERQKEIYNALNRIGKGLDKKFPEPLPNYGPLFQSPSNTAALNRVIAMHLLRTGSYDVAETFINEAGVDLGPHNIAQFNDLNAIITSLRTSDLDPALKWCQVNTKWLEERRSTLEFNLHRSKYIQILTQSTNAGPALAYARRYFPSLYGHHTPELLRLMAAPAFLPLSRLLTSPYADLLNDELHAGLESEFSREYCARLKLSRQLPLRVVGDLGGGGALQKIEKGKRVMFEKKTEWTAEDELPVEIPVPPENRYHSIFACPVSKEQATEMNPPMMLSCGHVLNKDSVQKLMKNGTRVKCPYCPVESTTPAQRVYF
ncbi:hypothetical protein DL93DRAFT_2072274 [Clavulina sp. PMI_390]|nr:hypothetical protein DL93DRAFT_2072274 [Clavulina sp. PMI_390]